MATWVPEEKQDAKWKIWHLKFQVSVPNIQTRSKDHIRLFGTPVSGDTWRDSQGAHELLDTFLSIDRMVVYHHQGVLVRLKKPSDAKVIYELVVEYLSYWKRYAELSLAPNPEMPPLEDLEAMNTFIQAVYPHAEVHLTTAVPESILGRRISGLVRGLTLRTQPPVDPSQARPDYDTPSAQPTTVAEKMFSNRKRFK